MSKRLHQRGRYPKNPGIDQITNPNTQFPQTTLAQHSVPSEVPYFTPVQSQVPSQNVWNHSYPNQSTYQQSQAPPPISESNAYWSSGHMYSAQSQQQNDPWNWPTESNYQQPLQHSEQQSSYVQEQQSSYVQEQQSSYVQEQQSNYLQEQLQTHYPQQQSSFQQQFNYQQHQSSHQQEQPSYLQQQLNQQSVGLPADSWLQSSQTQIENQNFVQQPISSDISSQSVQPVNNNCSNVSLDTSLQSWETDSLNISQPAQLPWTYSAPQYASQIPDLSTEFPSSSTTSNELWNSNSLVTSKSEISNQFQFDYKSNDSVQNGAVNLESNVSENYNTDESKDNIISNCVPNYEDIRTDKDLIIDADYGNSSLSAFFQNSEQNNSNSECGGVSTPDIQDNLDTASLEENLSHLLINESERSSIVTDGEHCDQNLEDTDDGGNQEVNFIQEEENHVIEPISHSVIGFSEEPGNQEVPEPNLELLLNSSQQAQANQDYHEMSPEEPLNQQIPIESDEKSRLSSERERVVIRPREESPFKPPRISNNSKGTIVQQEVPVQSVIENKHCKEKTVVQEVNLETFPDNLERPPDYEELKKQSSFYASHQKHLRTELNSSPSSLLCDNPDIPCVTLAPAAPPIHSSAKSDKSESSSDSKKEMSSFSKNPTKESNKNSSAGMDSDFSDKSLSMTKSNSLKDMDEKQLINRNYSSLSNQDFGNMQSEQQPSRPYLKDSKIEDIRNSEPYRKSASNMENLQNPNGKHNYNSVPHNDYSSSKMKSRDLDPRRHPPEYGHQKYPDGKYPGFEDRQYFSDRERSRHSSRSSIDDRSEDYRYHPRPRDFYGHHDDRRRRNSDYARPPSRSSESDLNRSDRQYHYDYNKGQYPYNAPYSRNADYYPRQQGYEFSQYPNHPYYDPYYYGPWYGYSNYNYGYYNEYNDPRYRQYAEEQNRQYYANRGYEGDYDRSSAHSGRSSANELTKDLSSVNYMEPDVDSNLSEISGYNIRQEYSYDDIPNDMSTSAADHSSTPSQRLTPVKFSYPHPIACFSAGGLLITAHPSPVNPTLLAPVKIQNMQFIMENQESYLELKNFQGPLVRGLTHKNDVIEFCNQKIRLLRQKDDVVDRDSYILLWELMILLLRQNGSVAGSDIAELLLKDHEVLRPHAAPLRHNIETPQGEHSPADVNDSSSQSHAGDTSSPDEGIVVLHDKTSLNTPKTVDVDKVTRKFREFLLFGHKKEALEWAMKHGLWGHALYLASKMDQRMYANVMARFANSLALNDPLQTLYQLMSGRQPSSVTCVVDKKWGDWRPHLAMILSNPSNMPDVDSRSVTTLGDTLASRGCLPAAQFCYIMAQVEFGTFEQKNSKIVLLTADHRLSFEEFSTNEAIQCTEVYEYAQSLANAGYLLVHLQMYKFLYALRLVEHGFLEEALHYCEVISGNLQNHVSLFTYDLISEVYKLASRLKYHDPHFLRGQGEYEDQDDPEWLKNLALLVQNYNNVMQDHNSEVQYEQQSELNQTLNDQMSPMSENISYQNIPAPGMQPDAMNSLNNMGFYQQNNVGMSWSQQSQILQNTANLTNNQQEIHSYYQGEVVNNQNNFHLDSSIPSHEENETTDIPSSPVAQTPTFDYYNNNQQVSDTKSSSYDQVNNYNTSNTRRERTDSGLSYSSSNLSVSRKPSIKESSKSEAKTESKPSTQAGKTWLGGIFSRLLPKTNQMCLPDDKNPSIVWDEVQKRWVNTDSNNDDETNAPLAPPTDMELMGSKSSEKPAVPVSNSLPPVATSPVNRFQRAKTKGMRQNYVDFLNNSGATTKTNVPPEAVFATGMEQSANANLFIPPPAPNINEKSPELENANSYSNSGIEQQEQSQVITSPLMFDPAEFESRSSNITNQKHMIGRSVRRTYPT